jgi:hypothetical protein
MRFIEKLLGPVVAESWSSEEIESTRNAKRFPMQIQQVTGAVSALAGRFLPVRVEFS